MKEPCPECESILATVSKPDGKHLTESVKYCKTCGVIMVEDKVITMDEQMKMAIKDHIEQAEVLIKDTIKRIEDNPEHRVQLYFTKVYSAGYIQGWATACESMLHLSKPGRLKRLAEIIVGNPTHFDNIDSMLKDEVCMLLGVENPDAE